MLEATIKRINKYYDWYPDMHPKDVRESLGCQYLYIHHMDIKKDKGIIKKVAIRNPLRRSDMFVDYPPLESWLADHYHPHIHLETYMSNRGDPRIYGYVEMFTKPIGSCPGLFSDPSCSLAEVYHCAAAFTYDILFSKNGPSVVGIERGVNGAKCAPELIIDNIAETVSALIDQKIMASHKSLIKAAQDLVQYVRTKVD